MTVLGLEDGKVALYPHDEAWETIAKDMMDKIREVMKDDLLAIDHDGGTSICCAWAKPIIDIIVLVPDFSVIEKHLPALSKLGMVPKHGRHGDGSNVLTGMSKDMSVSKARRNIWMITGQGA